MEQEHPKHYNINVIQVSMSMGTKLGLYMILVYAMLMYTLRYSALSVLALPLLLGIPVVAYLVLRQYRNHTKLLIFPFPVAWILSVFMFLFATVLSGMTSYIYLRFIDHGMLAQSVLAYVELMNSNGQQALATMTDPVMAQQYRETIDMITQAGEWFAGLPSSGVAKQLMQSSLMWGNIISIIISLLLMKRLKIKLP